MMTRQAITTLFLLGVALPFAQADLHLRKRTDEEAQIVEFERVDEEALAEYHNATEESFGLEELPIGKIGMCYGDCDSSDDCEEGLFCYHRDLDDTLVPGCTDEENPYLSTTNSVCIAQLPEDAWDRTSPIKSRRNLLSACRGDCDSDWDCDGNLVCHQRNYGDAVPGCRGKSLASSRDYCVQSKQGGGLGECQGDCNRDSDCAGKLVCKQRNAYDKIPSGCRGNIGGSTDYCVKPGNTGGGNTDGGNTGFGTTEGNTDVATSTTSSNSFRMKIYWQPGYNWQEQYHETYWCLTRDHNAGGTCWAGLRRMTCQNNQVYVTRCSGSSKQQWNFEHVGGEVMIKASGEDRCLRRNGNHIVLSSCNANSSMQRFYAPRGDINGYRFELSQKSAPRYCLNQDHHPKQAEYVQMFPCSWTRASDSLTSYWEKY